MTTSDEDKKRIHDFFLSSLIHDKPIARFGTLMKQVTAAAGLTQDLLRELSMIECEKLKQEGFLDHLYEGEANEENEPKKKYGLHQSAIARIFSGNQKPSYLQTYCFIKATKRYYSSPIIKRIFQEKGMKLPEFTIDLEKALWTLSGYPSVEEVIDACIAYQSYNHSPKRLPKLNDVAEEIHTNHDIEIINTNKGKALMQEN